MDKGIEEQLEQALKKQQDEAQDKRPNILICGYTGSGKSSLIKAILGDIVPDDAIGHGKPTTMGFDCFENKLVQIWDSRGMELGETEEAFVGEVRRFVRERQEDKNVDNHIHLIWYAISGVNKITDCDINLIKHVFNQKDVIVVITKTDITRDVAKSELKQRLLEAGIAEDRIVFTSDTEGGSIGCKELMKLSYKMLPGAYKDAFMEAQRIDIEAKVEAIKEKRGKAAAIIGAAAAAASATGAIPIPASDAPLLVAEQTVMIAGLAGLYRLAKDALKKAYLPMVAKSIGLMTASSLSKLVPGLGSVISAVVAGTLTSAMGWYVQRDFEKIAIAKAKGEPLPEPDFNFDDFLKFFKEFKKMKPEEEK